MIFKKYKLLLALLFAMLAVLALAVGVSADDETPSVPIDPPDVTSIKLVKLPYKTQYLVGEKLDMSGAELELTYDTGAKGSSPIKLDWTSGFSSTKEGTKTVTITYPDTQCKTTFMVEVVSEKSLKIVAPKVVTYFVGDVEDRGGLSVSLIYSNGKSVELSPSDYTVKGFSTNTVGEKTITVTYKKLTATYNITVFEPALTEIKITKKPNKLSYYIGDSLDTSGMKVTAIYANGKTADVTDYVHVSADISTIGTKTVTVSYTEKDHVKSATYQVSVIDVEIRNIVFVTYPTKRSYYENEAFDPTGISVKVTYNNGNVQTVSEGLLYTGFDSSSIGEKTVTLHYGGFQLDFTVSVSVSASHVHKETEYITTLDPTCTKEGVQTTTCKVCFAVVSTKSIAPLGHGDESMPVQTKAPTCTEGGSTSTYCMVCGDAVTVTVLPSLGHTEGAAQIITAPNCTDNGLAKTYCIVCTAEVSSTVLNAYGHTFSEWVTKVEPTEENDGREERTCSVCATVDVIIVPKFVHTLTSGSFSATLGGSSYFPSYSNFYGERATESLSAEQRLILTPAGENGKEYVLLEVFDFAVITANGEDFLPADGITFTLDYALPRSEYASILICDESFNAIPFFADGNSLSIICEGNGRYLIVGEIIQEETTETETIPETTVENTDNIPVFGIEVDTMDLVKYALIIVAILFAIIILICIITYASKKYR